MTYVRVACLIVVVSVLLGSETLAATLYVANNGVDSATCGAQTDPCRSINRAIDHASAGDTILVGPGNYGDLTQAEDFSAPGEEVSLLCGAGYICVDTALTIESTHGAQVTALAVVDVGSVRNFVCRAR
jgi:hypothetical protein